MNELYSYPTNDYRDYLQHHGTPGQKWGVRRAEWYPIAAWQASKRAAGRVKDVIQKRAAARREAKAIEEKRRKKVESLEKARRVKAEKQAREEAEKKEKAEINRVLTSGTKEEILKYEGKVDNRTLANALQNRIDLDQKISAINQQKVAKYEKLVDKAVKAGTVINNLGNAAKNASSGYREIKKFLENAGIIEKKAPVGFESALDIKKDIYKKVLSGEIDPKEYKNYSNAINSLNQIQKAAEGNKNQGSTRDETKPSESTSTSKADRKAEKEARKAEKRAERISKDAEARERAKEDLKNNSAAHENAQKTIKELSQKIEQQKRTEELNKYRTKTAADRIAEAYAYIDQMSKARENNENARRDNILIDLIESRKKK